MSSGQQPPGSGSDAATMTFPSAALSVADARRAVAAALVAGGVPQRTRDDVALVLSELMSNALRHARPLPGGLLRIEWSLDGSLVRVAVTDGGSDGAPAVRAAAESAQGGRGLGIVAVIAVSWGVDVQDDGTTVWAVLDSAGAEQAET